MLCCVYNTITFLVISKTRIITDLTSKSYLFLNKAKVKDVLEVTSREKYARRYENCFNSRIFF